MYWNDGGRGVSGETPQPATLDQAKLIWTDEVRGMQGNFFGLIDDEGNMIQFCFTEGIPNHIEDARHLEIVVMDFPVQDKQGSYQKMIRIDESIDYIARAFELGVHYSHYDGLKFESW